MTEVAADLPALDAFSDRTVSRRDHVDQVRSRMDAVRLPRDAFGYIPGIGDRTHDAYESFVDDCTTAVAQISDAVYELSQAVRKASEAYADSDQSSAGQLNNTGVLRPGVE